MKKHHSNSCAIEIKATKKNTIPKSALQDHQRRALQDSKGSNGLIHKLSDESRRQQPYDAFLLRNVDAYVIACFIAHGLCLAYDVDDWQGCRYDDEALFRIEL